MEIIGKISPFVERQFPEFYREEGREFIFFVKTYYEFLEQEGYPLHTGRKFFDIHDIDKTFDEYLIYFVNKYMNGIPLSMLGDKRFIEKNILDLYRSKGSFEGLKLLFRLLYNEDVQLYIPQYDVLKPSDGKWIKDYYLEVTDSGFNNLYQGQFIQGNISGSRALVETVETRLINGRRVNILLLSHISGSGFISDELVLCDRVSALQSCRIIGSVNNLKIITKEYGVEIGDTFLATNGKGKYLKGSIASLESKKGVIDFQLLSGGSGYSSNAVITISTGSNTTGSGASFIISEFSNTSSYFYSNTIIAPYVNVPLNSVPFGGPYANMALMDLNSQFIVNALALEEIIIGTITSLRITNPGVDYNGDITITITDPYTSSSPYGIGNNAIVLGKAFFQNNIMSTVNVIDSGFGYYDEDEIITFTFTANTEKTFTGQVVLGGIGYSEGYWKNTDSFLNSDKYIHDSYFYQEYSYQVKSSRSFDKYIDILRKINHPAGNLPFGKIELTTFEEEPIILIHEEISQHGSAPVLIGFNDWYNATENPSLNGSFPITIAPANNNFTFVMINGVIQHTDQYTAIIADPNNIVTLNGLVQGDDVGVFTIDSTYIDVYNDSYLGNGTTNQYPITNIPRLISKEECIVTINGVVQHIEDYTVFNNTVSLKINNLPTVVDKVEIRTIITKSTLSAQPVFIVDSYVGDGTTVVFESSALMEVESYAFVSINGIVQLPSTYVINNGNQIIMESAPAVNDKIQIRTFKSNIRV